LVVGTSVTVVPGGKLPLEGSWDATLLGCGHEGLNCGVSAITTPKPALSSSFRAAGRLWHVWSVITMSVGAGEAGAMAGQPGRSRRLQG